MLLGQDSLADLVKPHASRPRGSRLGTPSPPSDGGEGRGGAGERRHVFVGTFPPRSPPHSRVVGRGRNSRAPSWPRLLRSRFVRGFKKNSSTPHKARHGRRPTFVWQCVPECRVSWPRPRWTGRRRNG